jgi:hypothetical protein
MLAFEQASQASLMAGHLSLFKEQRYRQGISTGRSPQPPADGAESILTCSPRWAQSGAIAWVARATGAFYDESVESCGGALLYLQMRKAGTEWRGIR